MGQASTDEQIIGLLRADARMSFTDIGKRLKLSESAVRRRVKILVDGGMIKRFTLEMGDEHVTKAVAFVNVESGTDVAKVSARITALAGVNTVYEITGIYDIIAILSAPSISRVNSAIDELRRVGGVAETNTMIILRTVA